MDRKRGSLIRDFSNCVTSLIWCKITVVGDVGCGKTSLIKFFCENKYNSGYQPTVGVDYGFKIQPVDGEDLRVHLWDLSGAIDYVDVRSELYNGSDAVILVFDVTKSTSFDNLDYWLQELQSFGLKDAVIYLIANKVDLKDASAVEVGMARKWAVSHDLRFFETSCLTGEGIDHMMTALLREVLKERHKNAANIST